MDKLIIVDMQNDFIIGVLENEAALAIVPGICDAIQRFDGEVFLTQDIHFKFLYDKMIEGKSIPLHCEYDTKGAELYPDIEQAYNEWRINHHASNYFIYCKDTFAPEDNFFEPNEINDKDTIYICGTCTEICVVSTALKLRSVYPNNRIVCYSNLCAGLTPKSHEAALIVMENCLIEMENYEYEMAD